MNISSDSWEILRNIRVTWVTVSKILPTKIRIWATTMNAAKNTAHPIMISSATALASLIRVAIFKLKVSSKVSETYNK